MRALASAMLALALLWTPPAHAQTPATTAARAETQRTPTQALRAARRAYANYEFERISELLEPHLVPTSRFEDPEATLDALALYGVGLFIESERADDLERTGALRKRASEQFLRLIRKDPEYQLDPQLYSSAIIDFFDGVRADNADELDAIRAERGAANGDANGGVDTIYIQRAVRDNVFALNFVPFGVPQFQNNQPVKGTALAMSQGLSLAVNVSAYTWLTVLVRQNNGRFPLAPDNTEGPQKVLADNLQLTMYVSLGVFAALYIYGVIDGISYYGPESLERLETLPGPPPELRRDADPTSALPPAPSQWVGWTWRF